MPRQKGIKVLFVCHIASLSGAPILLLEIIREIKVKTLINVEIIIVVDGPLGKAFEALGKVHYWNPVTTTVKKSLYSSISFRIKKWSTAFQRRRIIKSVRDSTVIFFNTITNGHIQRELSEYKAKHICYVHEMEAAMHYATNITDLETALKRTDLFVACSNAVKETLVANYPDQEQKIIVLNTPLQETTRDKLLYLSFQEHFKKEHGIGSRSIIVGIVGPGEWRKGFDFFLPLVALYFELYPTDDVYFVWKGYDSGSLNSYFTRFDFKKIDVSNRVILLPHGKDAIATISCFDVHLLLSREDPYPLVLLEAASFGIPTLSFERAGGSIEFIEKDSGYVVPYGNLLKLAMKLNEVVRDTALRASMGLKARQKVNDRHSAVHAMAPFLDLIVQEFPDFRGSITNEEEFPLSNMV